MTIRILTYNIHGGTGIDRKHDYKRIGLFFQKEKIDIALLQEMDTRPARRSTEQDIADIQDGCFEHFAAAPAISGPSGWYGNAVLSRYPITRNNVIDTSAPGREPRNIQEVFIETPAGPLHLVNTHKGLKRTERGVQMAALKAMISHKSEVPLVVGGDLNEWHTNAAALKSMNEILQPVQAGATYPTFFPLFHLDRMWCRPAGLVVKSHVLITKETKIYSDHYPLLAEIRL